MSRWVKASKIGDESLIAIPFRYKGQPAMGCSVGHLPLKTKRGSHTKFQRHIESGQVIPALTSRSRQVMNRVFTLRNHPQYSGKSGFCISLTFSRCTWNKSVSG